MYFLTVERTFFTLRNTEESSTEIYMTMPTKVIMKNILSDFLSISYTDHGAKPIYRTDDLDKCFEQVNVINYKEEKSYNGINFTCYPAGHVLGAAMFCVEIDGIRVL